VEGVPRNGKEENIMPQIDGGDLMKKKVKRPSSIW
jgi:hypothetical protein